MESTSSPHPGDFFGKCRLIRLIGTGGMGAVFLGEHLFLKRQVAIKILSRDLSAEPDEVERFEREAISAARLDHPNIVAIHDVDEVEGRPFIVMEFVDGEDLEDLLRRKSPLPVRSATRIVRDVAAALDHSHAAGVVHRDIKPGNILLGKNGKVKITDFGLAQDVGTREKTEDGMILGTPYFASPEQIDGEILDGRSDVYSLGVTYFTMLTGQRPFQGASPVSVVRKHFREDRPTPRMKRPALDLRVNAIVRRMMALDREDRYPTAKALMKELDLYLAGKPFLRVRL